MRIWILLLLPLFISFSYVENKKRDIKVDAGIYEVLYSESLEQPKEV